MERLAPPRSKIISEADYLLLEAASATKHEFRHGEMIDMAGGTLEHADLAANIVSQLKIRMKVKPCKAVGSDLRVRISSSAHYCYPDAIIFCGDPIFDPPDKRIAISNPQVVVEVTSPSSETDDRGDKFYDYMTIDSLLEYMIVSQDKIRVDTFYRQTDGIWAVGPSATSIEAVVTSARWASACRSRKFTRAFRCRSNLRRLRQRSVTLRPAR